jgi:hypothetical protein
VAAELCLEQYEAAFRDNAITEKVLPNLTAEDLKDFGVGMVGHRRTLLDAIALLRLMRARKRRLPKLPQHLLSALKTLTSAAKLR